MEAGWDKEDPHCFGYMENLIFVTVIGMFMKRSTVPTRVVQYSLGYTIIFVPGCTAWTVGFPTVSARYPNPSLGLALQDGYCRPQTTTAPESYGCYADVGVVPTFYKPANSTPLGVLLHCVDLATCVRVKNTVKKHGEKAPIMGIRTPTHHQKHL